MGEWPPFGGDDLPHSGDDARFVILPVPYDETATYRKGTADGPRAILAASHQIELFDEELGFDPLRDGVQTCDGSPTCSSRVCVRSFNRSAFRSAWVASIR